jgi:hypothetical protein
LSPAGGLGTIICTLAQSFEKHFDLPPQSVVNSGAILGLDVYVLYALNVSGNSAKTPCNRHVQLTLVILLNGAKAAFNKKNNIFTSKLDLNLRKKLVKCYIWSMALYGAETWTLRAVDQKHLESFEMWCWRRMEKISWTDHVRNEEVLFRVSEQRNILHEIRKRKANWIGLRGYSHLKEEALDRIKWRNRYGRGCGPVV